MKQRNYILLQLFFFTLSISANDVAVKISSPQNVEVGETFRISYEISTNDIEDFQAPDFKGFHLIDSHQSTSSSISNINGKISSKSTTTISFILEAYQEGDFIIQSAIIRSNGKKIVSKSIPVHVSGHTSKNQNTNANSPNNNSQNISPSQSTLSENEKDLFVRAIASKQKVYEQEAILLTYKIYTSTNAYGFQGKLPVLDGFHIQEIDLGENQTTEMYNGKKYMTAIWKQYVLYPQLIGKCEIPSITCEATVVSQNGYMDPFGMIPRTSTSIRRMNTSPITIEVLPLPEAPSTYSGAVGDFNLTSSVNKTKLKSNDVLSLKVNLSGVGNFKLMDTPDFKFPKVFETYDSKVTDNFHLTTKGNEGQKTFEFLAVPRESGTYTLPPMEFTYFNPQTKSYHTLCTQEYKIEVESVIGSDVTQSNPSELNKDIRYIKTGDTDLRRGKITNLYSYPWIIAYLISLLSFFLVLYIIHRHKNNQADILSISKRANVIAMRRLKNANKEMESGNRERFFDELLNTLNKYISDKFNIDKEKLNKENIRLVLGTKRIDSQTIDEFINLVNDCEFARYAPEANSIPMNIYYNKSIQLISSLESCTK